MQLSDTISEHCLFDGAKRHFQQFFSYIVAVSFIGGRNRRTRRKHNMVVEKMFDFTDGNIFSTI
jgi:hypothetical protein